VCSPPVGIVGSMVLGDAGTSSGRRRLRRYVRLLRVADGCMKDFEVTVGGNGYLINDEPTLSMHHEYSSRGLVFAEGRWTIISTGTA
jgi:hypothetical protein